MMREVVYFIDSGGFGGAERALLLLLAGLDRERWRPVLAYHSAPGFAGVVDEARGLGVELWEVPPMPDGVVGAVRVVPFARALRRRGVDVFHAHLTWPLACKFGLMGALLAGVPAVVATEHLFVDVAMDRWVAFQQRVLMLGVGRYIAVSYEVARRLQAVFGVPGQRLEVIQNAVPCGRFERVVDPVVRAALGARDGQPVIVTPARLDVQKGHRYLLEAAVLVPDALFVLVGDGPERAVLEAQAQMLGMAGRVRFLGYRDDVPDVLACCDVVVLPSLFEGLPLVVLEAMAAGKPVVASRIGGTDEAVVHGVTGVLVPPADPMALARAIGALLACPALAAHMAAAGRVRVRQVFGVDAMVARTMAVYDEVLGS